MSNSIATVCANCGKDVTTPFCDQCGQQNPPPRLELKQLMSDFVSRIYGFDGMFLRTIKDLTIFPGHVSRAFIEGNRVKYVGPVGYFFLLTAMTILIMDSLSISFFDFQSSSNPFASKTGEAPSEMYKRLMQFIGDSLKLFRFVHIPLLALWTWMWFRHRITLLKAFVPGFYFMGQLELLNILNVLMFYFLRWNFYGGYVYSFVSVILYATLCYQLFDRKVGTFIKGMAVWFLAYISYMALFVLAMLLFPLPRS